MQMIPFSFNGIQAQDGPFTPTAPGLFMGVHIHIQPQALEFLLAKIEAWYEDRDEVILVDSGISSKLSQGYIILEFEECEPDVLLLSILDHEEVVLDYVVYVRESEVAS